MGEEYLYIFSDGKWVGYDMHEFDEAAAPERVNIPTGALAV